MWPAQPVSTTNGGADHRVDQHERRELRLRGLDDERKDQRERKHPETDDTTGDPHLGEAGELGGDRPHRPHRPPVGDPRLCRSRQPVAAQQQGDNDHDEQHGVDVRAVLERPRTQLLGDAKTYGRNDRDRKTCHARDHRGGERLQQQVRAAARHARVRHEPEDRYSQQHGQRGEQTRDRPHHRRQAVHRKTQQLGAVAVVCRGSDGDAVVGEAKEPHQSQEHDGHDHDGEDVIAVEHHRKDRELGVERGGERAAVVAVRPTHGDHDADAVEHLREPDGRHRDDQAGRIVEPADDEDLEDRTERGGDREPAADGREVIHVQLDVELDGEDGPHRSELGGREVDHAVGAIHEDDRDGDQGVDCAEDCAGENDAGGRAVWQQRREQPPDRDRGRGARCRMSYGAPQTRPDAHG
jgi:hypothetical protein